MPDDAVLGRQEIVIVERAGAGCVLVVAPVVAFFAYHFVKASWSAVRGVEPILEDSPALNVVVALAILGGSLLLLLVSVSGFVGAAWRPKMKFYERGMTLHGGWEGGGGPVLYAQIESLRLTASHRMERVKNRYGVPTGERYENTEYTFDFRLKTGRKPKAKRKRLRFKLVHDRNDNDIDAVVRRLEMEGVRVERPAAESKADADA